MDLVVSYDDFDADAVCKQAKQNHNFCDDGNDIFWSKCLSFLGKKETLWFARTEEGLNKSAGLLFRVGTKIY